MNTKLTLQMDDNLVQRAKSQAKKRGKSVSQMFSDYISNLGTQEQKDNLPPVTRSLLGILESKDVSKEDYRQHLREKHL